MYCNEPVVSGKLDLYGTLDTQPYQTQQGRTLDTFALLDNCKYVVCLFELTAVWECQFPGARSED